MKLMQRLVVVVSLCSVFYTQSGGYYIIDYDIAVATNAPLSDEFKFGAAAVGVGLAAWFLYDKISARWDIDALKKGVESLRHAKSAKEEFLNQNNYQFESSIKDSIPRVESLYSQLNSNFNFSYSKELTITMQDVADPRTITTIQRPFWLRKYKEIDDLNTKIVELKNDQSLVGYWALAYAWNRFKPLYNRHYSLLANYKRCSFLREDDLYELVAVTNSSQGTYPLLDAGNELNRNEKHLDDVRSTLNTGNSNSEDRGQLKDCFTLVMPRIEKFIVDFKTMNAALKCSESYRKQLEGKQKADAEYLAAEAELFKAQAENRKAYAQQQEAAAASNAYNAQANLTNVRTAQELEESSFFVWLLSSFFGSK